AILLSKRGHLTRIDCRTSRHDLIAPSTAMASFKILLVFSGLRKTLASTEYNQRVIECAEAARTLLAAAGRGGCEPILGNLSASEYAAHQHALQGAPARRAAHFFSEV